MRPPRPARPPEQASRTSASSPWGGAEHALILLLAWEPAHSLRPLSIHLCLRFLAGHVESIRSAERPRVELCEKRAFTAAMTVSLKCLCQYLLICKDIGRAQTAF